MGLKRTVGSWGLRGEAEILPVWEQREQRSGCMSEPGAVVVKTGELELWWGWRRKSWDSEHRTGAGAQSSRVKGSCRVGERSDFKASGGG